MKLSIVIPCREGQGVARSLESLQLHHAEALEVCEVLVVGAKQGNEWLIDEYPDCRFIDFSTRPRIARLINAAISMAAHQHVLCIQPDCILESGAITQLIDFYNMNHDSRDLFQGPLVKGNRNVRRTIPWQINDAFEEIPDTQLQAPLRLETQDLGVFSCRRDAWPGVNGLFKIHDGFGYIHDKFRARGSECICLPWFRWSRAPITPIYHPPNQVHDIALWFAETGGDPRDVLNQVDAEYHEVVPVVRSAHTRNKIAPHEHRIAAPGCGELISCITVAGDASDHALNECVESFRRQTYPRRELVIVNDKKERSIHIEVPLVKVVDIPDFCPEDLLLIAGGDLICMWPADRIAYPTKLSVMFSQLVHGCAWSDQCFDMSWAKVSCPPAFMFTREAFAPAASLDSFADLADELGKSYNRVYTVQDLIGDRTCPWEKGRQSYQLAPSWANPSYEKMVVSCGCQYPIPNSIVVFLLMYNLLEWPRAIIEKLREFENLHIVLVDQGSTYQPLLDFYDSCGLDLRSLPYLVGRSEFVNQNAVIHEFCQGGDFFLVVDPDIDISGLPVDILDVMVRAICDYGGPAVGLGIDSAEPYPDTTQLQRYWDKPGGRALFPFTMYRLGTHIHGIPQHLLADHTVRHLPWEIDVAGGLSEELVYYVRQRLAVTRSAAPGLIDEYLSLVEKPGDDP